MKTLKTTTGWLAQGEHVMTYATPDVRQDHEPTLYMYAALDWAGLTRWEPTTAAVYDAAGKRIDGFQVVKGKHSHITVTTDKYRPIEHLSHLLPVMKTVSDTLDAPCTGVLVNDDGKSILARFTTDQLYMDGDPSPYAKETWVRLRHDARGALTVFERAQRLFCTNQIPVLSSVANADLMVRHTGDIDVKVNGLVERLKSREDDWVLWEKEMATLQSTTVRPPQFEEFTRLFIPEPLPPVSPVRAQNAQNELQSLWRGYTADLGQTAYAGYQAIVEFEDKVRASRGGASRMQRAINPNPNKSRGLRMLMEVAR